jgi:hypothetical protein
VFVRKIDFPCVEAFFGEEFSTSFMREKRRRVAFGFIFGGVIVEKLRPDIRLQPPNQGSLHGKFSFSLSLAFVVKLKRARKAIFLLTFLEATPTLPRSLSYAALSSLL